MYGVSIFKVSLFGLAIIQISITSNSFSCINSYKISRTVQYKCLDAIVNDPHHGWVATVSDFEIQ